MTEIWAAFVLIFIAELGDKSQLLAMTLATRYRIRTVLGGVAIGIVANHGIAILLGRTITTMLTPNTTALVISGIFVAFGLLSLGGESSTALPKQWALPGLVVVSGLFFLGEFADKTQFATMALAMESSRPWLLLLGTSSAMMSTSALAIWIGKTIGDRFPELALKLVSTQVFIGYGVIRLIQSDVATLWWRLALVGSVVAIDGLLVLRTVRGERRTQSIWKQRAKELYAYYHTLAREVDRICLGTDVCGSCESQGCLIGHVKYLIEQGKMGQPTAMGQLSSKTWKQVEPKRVKLALDLTVSELRDHWQDASLAPLHQIRQNLEYLLYRKTLRSPTFEDYMVDIRRLNEQRGA
jgi:putative Ca2+/H+ antiporter (TMEM165/GDT1 family)